MFVDGLQPQTLYLTIALELNTQIQLSPKNSCRVMGCSSYTQSLRAERAGVACRMCKDKSSDRAYRSCWDQTRLLSQPKTLSFSILAT